MSKRISISCPDHVYKLLSGLSELQSRPMSKIVVELLEASYPALNSVYHMLIRLEAEKRRADRSVTSGHGWPYGCGVWGVPPTPVSSQRGKHVSAPYVARDR